VKCWKWWRTVMCGGSILSCCPRNPHGYERALKEEDFKGAMIGGRNFLVKSAKKFNENAIKIRFPLQRNHQKSEMISLLMTSTTIFAQNPFNFVYRFRQDNYTDFYI